MEYRIALDKSQDFLDTIRQTTEFYAFVKLYSKLRSSNPDGKRYADTW